MTQVVLHGILAKEFKKNFFLAIKKPREVFDAISCSHSNFRNRVSELAFQGIHFTLLVNGKKITELEELSIASDNQRIDIVPLICGSGFLAFIALAVVKVGAFIANSAILSQLAVGAALMGLQMLLAPKPKMDRPEATVNAAKQSFMFSSKANVTEQGIPVPVGYGRLRVGSVVIQSSIKSHPQSLDKGISLAVGDGQVVNNDKFV